jgi:hypothetical protein
VNRPQAGKQGRFGAPFFSAWLQGFMPSVTLHDLDNSYIVEIQN